MPVKGWKCEPMGQMPLNVYPAPGVRVADSDGLRAQMGKLALENLNHNHFFFSQKGGKKGWLRTKINFVSGQSRNRSRLKT